MKRFQDCEHDALSVAEYFVVPKANDSITALLKPPCASPVPHVLFTVLPAVDFNDELGFGAKEVDDVWTDRLLAAKARSLELLAAQARP